MTSRVRVYKGGSKHFYKHREMGELALLKTHISKGFGYAKEKKSKHLRTRNNNGNYETEIETRLEKKEHR